MKSITTTGLDIAKSVFQVHCVDAQQKIVVARKLKRGDVLAFFRKLPPHLVGIEACGSAHDWARELTALGHTVKLMPPQYVKAYLQRGKTDASDAAAICEAVTRAHVKPVPVKTVAQQCALLSHKARESLISMRTEQMNRIRSHLSEFGVIAPVGNGFEDLLRRVFDDTDATVPADARPALRILAAVLAETDAQIAALDQLIKRAFKACETSRRLQTIPTVGPLTANAAAAIVSNARIFPSGREFAASLGLTPRLEGTGGKVTLGPVTKQGNQYLRRLLYLGAVSRLGWARRNPSQASPWMLRLLKDKPFKVAAIALANKTARIIWALLAHGGTYTPGHCPAQSAPAALGASA